MESRKDHWESELKVTEDGSHTLFVPELDENYHSTHGAVQESRHVFIQAGLLAANSRPLRVLEIGFGTGLNALLTWQAAIEKDFQVVYHSIERYPVEEKHVLQLNYPLITGCEDATNQFQAIHRASWGEETKLDSHFSLKKIHDDLKSYTFEGGYDVIYFDAFGPEKQPEMWEYPIFEKLYSQLREGGIFVTYCAKGVVRRALQSVGLKVERLPGPPGKREMLRGQRVHE